MTKRNVIVFPFWGRLSRHWWWWWGMELGAGQLHVRACSSEICQESRVEVANGTRWAAKSLRCINDKRLAGGQHDRLWTGWRGEGSVFFLSCYNTVLGPVQVWHKNDLFRVGKTSWFGLKYPAGNVQRSLWNIMWCPVYKCWNAVDPQIYPVGSYM